MISSIRRFLALSAIAAAAIPAAHADNIVATLDPNSAGAIAANPVTNRIWLSAEGKLAWIDGANNKLNYVPSIPMASGNAIAVNPLTNKVYVANGASFITVVDGVTLATNTVPTGNGPSDIAIDTVTNTIYTSDSASANVTVIDGASLETAWVPVGTSPQRIAVNQATHRVYVTNNGSANVTVIDGATLATTPVAAGTGPLGVAVNSVTNRIYVSNFDSNNVTVINGDTNTTATVTTAAGPNHVAVNPRTNRIYVATHGPSPGSNGIVTVIDGATLATTPVTAGALCCALAVNTESNKIYAASFGYPITYGGNLTVIDGFTNATQVLSAPGQYVAVNPATNRIYTTYSNRVSSTNVGAIFVVQGTTNAACDSADCPDLVLSQTRAANPAVGKDLVLDFFVSNVGQVTASNVTLSEPIPAGSTYVWASPGCTLASSTVTCNLGSMAIFTSATARVVVRPLALGPLVSTATVSATEPESTPYNNSHTLNMAVSSTPAGVPVFRYRLYSPVTLEHHFTTDLNEYTVLGSNGNWNMEGAIGKVLDNPGVYNGVQATPYYRLYNTSNSWHHWTSDANEYYTLIQFANWSAEGVDGYILPTTTTNATPLYRLLYPFIAGLHHWTTDANEYNTLIANYGWIGEGGSGFVIQTGAPP